MLRRAKQLQPIFDEYCMMHQYLHFKLNKEEWRQIEYLLWVTQPFFQFTTALSKTKDVTVHLIFGIYNKLFDHLEASIQQLQRKKVPWKKTMLDALEAARSKLSDYCGNTDNELHGDIFAISTIMAPSNKLQFFSTKDWEDDTIDYCARYRNSLDNYLERYKKQLSDKHILPMHQPSTSPTSELEMLLNSTTPGSQHFQTNKNNDELTQYLERGQCLFYVLDDYD